VWVGFKDGAVHKSTGVTFISVTDNIFRRASSLAAQFPFGGRGESGSAASTEAGLLDFFDNLFGRHVEKNPVQGLVAATLQVILDPFRIDAAAVTQQNTLLPLIEVYVRVMWPGLTSNRVGVEQPGYYLVVSQMLLHNFRNILDGYATVKYIFWFHYDSWTDLTKTVATSETDRDIQAEPSYFVFQAF
jgi:hypothetical protein